MKEKTLGGKSFNNPDKYFKLSSFKLQLLKFYFCYLLTIFKKK